MKMPTAAILAKLLLVILALWMPISTFAAAAAPASSVEAPCEEPPSPNEAAESQTEETETAHASFCGLRRAPEMRLNFSLDSLARGAGERGEPPHQPPNPSAPR